MVSPFSVYYNLSPSCFCRNNMNLVHDSSALVSLKTRQTRDTDLGNGFHSLKVLYKLQDRPWRWKIVDEVNDWTDIQIITQSVNDLGITCFCMSFERRINHPGQCLSWLLKCFWRIIRWFEKGKDQYFTFDQVCEEKYLPAVSSYLTLFSSSCSSFQTGWAAPP